VDWVLGQNRSLSAPFIVTEVNSGTGAIFARNPWNEQFGERVAFSDLNGDKRRGRATARNSWAATAQWIGRLG
jgi:cyclic beta-1,2-glucan synthetase